LFGYPNTTHTCILWAERGNLSVKDSGALSNHGALNSYCISLRDFIILFIKRSLVDLLSHSGLYLV